MFLQSITLVQFRNFSRLQAELPPGLSVFAGANGSGKSNVLEAAAVLASGQSHRGADPRHMVQWGLDGLALKGEFRPSAAGEEAFTVEVKQKAGRPRQTSVNGAAQKRLRDWAGRAPLVAFSPDDLFLVKGEPALRRRALNDLLGQVDGAYLEALQRYNKVLAERNETLRQIQRGERNRSALEPWTAALLKDGAAISLARRDFLPGFSALAARKHGELAGAGEAAAILYKPSLALEAAAPSGDPDIPPGESAPARQADPASNEAAAVSAAARRRLEELREAEIAVGGTLIGPHRDDLEFLLNGWPWDA
jgi:DNA replication and repair protein RecF